MTANQSYQRMEEEKRRERNAHEEATRERPDVSKLFPTGCVYCKSNPVMWPGWIAETIRDRQGKVKVHVSFMYNGGSSWYEPEELVGCTRKFAKSRSPFCTQYGSGG